MSQAARTTGTILLMCVVAIIITCTLFTGYWIGDRAIPVEVTKTTLLTPTVKPGGVFQMSQEIVYVRNCSGHIDRWLYDSATPKNRKQLEDVDYATPPLGIGEQSLKTTEVVPSTFEEGEGLYVANPVYKCNPFHNYFWPIDRRPTVIRFQIKK